ncbi:3'-5' exonuclease [Flavobacteriaceae bacterium]|uniref:3'-5' exonuclease n=1 Tax=Candidatus Arcticimaribacter forsetii TaxID=2820661 RepID=UPI0020774944|nr:3'-5' exonuclease [Candidatus Arcticimaribacter forsetii]MDB2345971.1 3'-5' exonuclease [Flavobacteriaceae bacterium]MDB2457126.1 3'-5' exonuclease [Flavobacteriaceae bacterium]MDB4620883.1 3'-5' exonuclease [Flavobacteriaceae bacterium]MDB4675073.1 3'-5' exonuclease [Flavobacteriaceae bacterium]
MGLNLQRPLCFFDLETTGINVVKDRIVEIAVLKLFPNGNKESKTWLVNPEMPIPKGASDIHGITDEKVKDSPNFKTLSTEIYAFMKDCDWAGYNSDRFDIPLIAEEFMRAGVDFDLKNHKTIDVQTIFHKMEQRTLTAALKFYCDKELINAHSAMADTDATYEILLAQVDRYDELENNLEFLSNFSTRKRSLDVAGFIVLNKENQPCFSFGKHKGKTVEEVLEKEPGYFGWLLNADFPLYTKKVLTALRLSKFNGGS